MAIKVRPIGIAVMSDEEGSDNKVIAVPVEKVDPSFGSYKNASDIPEFMKNRLKHFFEHYKELEKGKFMKFEKFESKEEAMKELKESRL
jgi:inorganic pyrophosphatase